MRNRFLAMSVSDPALLSILKATLELPPMFVDLMALWLQTHRGSSPQSSSPAPCSSVQLLYSESILFQSSICEQERLFVNMKAYFILAATVLFIDHLIEIERINELYHIEAIL